MTKGTERGAVIHPLSQPLLWRLHFTRAGVSSQVWTGCRAGAKVSAAWFSLWLQPGHGGTKPVGMGKPSSARGGGLYSFSSGSFFFFPQPSCLCRGGRMLAEWWAVVLLCGEMGGSEPLQTMQVSQHWGSLMALSCPFAFWHYSNKLSTPVSLGQVKEELMSSIRAASESPVLPELPSAPSATNGTCPCSGGGWRAVGTQWCLPRSAPCVPLQSLPPCCVLMCFYNKDNSAASCHFSSLSLVGGTNESPLWLYPTCPLGNKQAQMSLGYTSSCK